MRPFTQRSDLGWVIVGDVCLGNAHKVNVSVFKTNLLENGRPSYLTPCKSFIKLKDKVCHGGEQCDVFACVGQVQHGEGFRTDCSKCVDNKLALSIEDTVFLKIILRF